MTAAARQAQLAEASAVASAGSAANDAQAQTPANGPPPPGNTPAAGSGPTPNPGAAPPADPGASPGTASPPASPGATPPAAAGAGPGTASPPAAAAGDPGTDWTEPTEARFVNLPFDSFKGIVGEIAALVTQADALLVNPTSLTPDQRKHSGGKLRDGEAAALQLVLNVARKYPANFASLANIDDGVDPTVFEVDLVSDRLAKAALLAPLVAQIADLSRKLSDSSLEMAQGGAAPAHEAYKIAKPLARTNPIVSSLIAPTIAFYSALGKAAAASRKANVAAKAAQPPPQAQPQPKS